MLKRYFANLYRRSMEKAYDRALEAITAAVREGGMCLDCGANAGYWQERLSGEVGLGPDRYHGIEWNRDLVDKAREKGLDVRQGDLNRDLPYPDGTFDCVFALSVLEHLLNGCHFLQECHRVLKRGGTLVILTPNISTYFTAMLVLAGKMPSSGPHPDSQALLGSEEIFKVSPNGLTSDAEAECPVHRHLVVFSYRVLKKYLGMVGYTGIKGYGYGLYPLPNWLQPLAERIDPWHCHQMVFIARK